MIHNLIDTLRQVLGEPEFYVQLGNQTNYSWDYGAMLEYMCAVIILCIVISSVFKFIRKLV